MRVRPLISAVAIAVVTTPCFAKNDGQTLWVRNNGVDSAECGSRANACRSISQAIENASAGDTILVGIGRYGDLNRDSVFDAAGEEHLNVAEGCMVCVTKPLSIFSIFGADMTVIDGTTTDPLRPDVLKVLADNVTIGRSNQGFTISGGSAYGFVARSVDNLRVVGNVAKNNAFVGFLFEPAGSSLQLIANRAENNSSGFTVYNSTASTVIRGNIADSNRTGFNISGVDTTVLRNIANNNEGGFSIEGHGMLVKNNAALNNLSSGFGVSGATLYDPIGSRFVGNTIVGNRNEGMFITFTARGTVVTGNNIYGNGGHGQPTDTSSRDNCGIFVDEVLLVNATNNYWGAPTGPGPNPADDAGVAAVCDVAGARTTVVPFAGTPFPVEPDMQ
jgi:parallel beta-helix repeat protein